MASVLVNSKRAQRRRKIEEEKVTGSNTIHQYDLSSKYNYKFTWWKVKTAVANAYSVGKAFDINQTAPKKRSGCATFMISPFDNKVFVHGGASDGEYFSDLWALDTKARRWQPVHTYLAPRARAYHQIVVVPPHSELVKKGSRKAVPRLVLFGGFMEGTLFGEVEVLEEFSVMKRGLPKLHLGKQPRKSYKPPDPNQTVDVWRTVELGGEPPLPRCSHTLSVVGHGTVVLIGGWHGEFTGDVYTLDTDIWEWTYRKTTLHESAKSGFPPRAGHTATVIHGRRIVVFGGQNSTQGQLADLWVLDTATWEWSRPSPAGTPPIKRSGHSAVFNREGHIYVFGGWDGVRMRNDIHMLSVAGDPQTHWKWKKPSVQGEEIPPRASCSMCLVADWIWVYGGWNSETFLDDVHLLEIQSEKRDAEKDRAIKEKIKKGLKHVGSRADQAAFTRARERGIDPLAMMEPEFMSAEQVEAYQQNIGGKIQDGAAYMLAKNHEVHFLKDKQDQKRQRERSVQVALEHQLRVKRFLEQGASMQEAIALAGGYADPEVMEHFGVDGYRTVPPAPHVPRRRDLTQEEIDARVHGRAVYYVRDSGAEPDIIDAILQSGGLKETWEANPHLFPPESEEPPWIQHVAPQPSQAFQQEGSSIAQKSNSNLSAGSDPQYGLKPAKTAISQLAVSEYDEDFMASRTSHSLDSGNDEAVQSAAESEFDGKLSLTREGDEGLEHMNTDMGPVLRQIMREQANNPHLKQRNLKIPLPPRYFARPERILPGNYLPSTLDELLGIESENNMAWRYDRPYDPQKNKVAQDLDDIVQQSDIDMQMGDIGLRKSHPCVSPSALGCLVQGEDPEQHPLLALALDKGVYASHAIQAARGDSLPLPGVSFGTDSVRPVPTAMQKIAAGMQKIAKGWMQKKIYRQRQAALRIQALVRGRQARKKVAQMRAERGLAPFRYGCPTPSIKILIGCKQ
mmetsp:Transcript_40435/g.96088  ORF Transcript_40435/g.96088 Transcript_40435/m.96088 type:complete len:961 (-) Transcript_40435:290-3172(-)